MASDDSPRAGDGWRLPAGSGDRWAEDYERGRPGYPRGVANVAGLSPSSTVLDLGAGTGKLTRVLVGVFDRVIAVEPAKAMRQMLKAQVPDAEAVPASAQRIPLPDDSVDAVFAAEAFHRFKDEQAISEIGRVLRPGGALILVWNLPAGPWTPSTESAEHVLRKRMPPVDYIPLDLGGPRNALEGLAAAPFETLREVHYPNPQTLDREGLVAFYASMGWIGDLPDDERLPLLQEVTSRLTSNTYRREWETDVYWTRLQAGRNDQDSEPTLHWS